MTRDVVIVGAGVEGLSTAHALATSGVTNVVVVDRDAIASGGTGRSAGIVRCHYGVPEIAALARESLTVFSEAEERLGSPVGFEQVGYLVGIGEDNLAAFRASLAAQQALGIDTGEVGHDVAAALWPVAELDDFASFAFEPQGGYADGYATAHAFAGSARSLGTTVTQGTAVASIEVRGDAVTGVRLADGTGIATDAVVVAASAWSVPLLSPLGIELPITPYLVQEVLIDPGVDLGARPVFSDMVSKQYVHQRGHELLFGDSGGFERPIPDPDRYPTHAEDAAIERCAEKALHRFPGIADPSVKTTSTGMIDVTPDWNPIISATGIDGLFVAAGFSGHGFKIAPAVGRLMADIVLGRPSSVPDVPTETFRLSRYDEGAPVLSKFPYVGASKIR
ncbi:FAD-binding oxidoreductase [Actinotalea sp. M2MS4P-6]|uniref:NAD(P)/FAD-dependent oxidoreductase n=1 Tax=Actinotalea sp. M2MS4P-6 TaxID=2983762 RepID=UPI0021E36BD6|nr:FAD-binding oxidoreductase [Actinotalea sp. M2MS4P-6]MCV2393828.1 FAD-binding oxidoreductase [Actinotalea sp. M2MS4P-6]